MSGKYDDIIGMEHHVSAKHPRMSMLSRAAQFSSFAALTGYDESVREMVRSLEETPQFPYEPGPELGFGWIDRD